MNDREPITILDTYTERTGNVTVAHIVAYLGNNPVHVRGASIRHPDDKMDANLGSSLAMARAMEALNRRVQRYTNGLLKQQEYNVRTADAQKRKRSDWEARLIVEEDLTEEMPTTLTAMANIFNASIPQLQRHVSQVLSDIRAKLS